MALDQLRELAHRLLGPFGTQVAFVANVRLAGVDLCDLLEGGSKRTLASVEEPEVLRELGPLGLDTPNGRLGQVLHAIEGFCCAGRDSARLLRGRSFDGLERD